MESILPLRPVTVSAAQERGQDAPTRAFIVARLADVRAEMERINEHADMHDGGFRRPDADDRYWTLVDERLTLSRLLEARP